MLDINLEKQLPVITMNFAEVKASLLESVKKYKGMIVTEETLKDSKADQKELASLRIKIDNYRKEVKKEMLKPVDAFENQCKELIGLIVEPENLLKENISVFDQKKKDANRKIAEDMILEAIKEHGLTEKYSSQLNVLDKYCNLTAKASDVKNDIDSRCYLLLQEQEQEAEVLQIMKDTIENCNKNIDAKMSMEDFQSLIDAKASPVKVMQEIQGRAERIKLAEEKAAAEKAEKAEREVQERIAKAEKEAREKALAEERAASLERERLAKIEIDKKLAEEKEAERIRIASLPKEESQKEYVETLPVIGEPTVTQEVVQPIVKVDFKEEQPLYFIEMRVEATLDDVKKLSKFLQDNNYKYEATKKGLVE